MTIPRIRIIFLISGLALMPVLPLIAHHSILPFDLNHPVEIHGSVLSFQWRNPHVRIDVSMMENKESVVWTIEADSPRSLESLGWSKSSLAPGQIISVFGAPARDGSPSVLCESVIPDGGSRLPCLPQAQR
jgi:hypothetical protein